MDLLNDCVDGKISYAEAIKIAKGMPQCLNCTQPWGNCGFNTFHFCIKGYKPDTEGILQGKVDWTISAQQIREYHKSTMTPEAFEKYYKEVDERNSAGKPIDGKYGLRWEPVGRSFSAV
jgi:hypothetical protein